MSLLTSRSTWPLILSLATLKLSPGTRVDEHERLTSPLLDGPVPLSSVDLRICRQLELGCRYDAIDSRLTDPDPNYVHQLVNKLYQLGLITLSQPHWGETIYRITHHWYRLLALVSRSAPLESWVSPRRRLSPAWRSIPAAVSRAYWLIFTIIALVYLGIPLLVWGRYGRTNLTWHLVVDCYVGALACMMVLFLAGIVHEAAHFWVSRRFGATVVHIYWRVGAVGLTVIDREGERANGLAMRLSALAGPFATIVFVGLALIPATFPLASPWLSAVSVTGTIGTGSLCLLIATYQIYCVCPLSADGRQIWLRQRGRMKARTE